MDDLLLNFFEKKISTFLYQLDAGKTELIQFGLLAIRTQSVDDNRVGDYRTGKLCL